VTTFFFIVLLELCAWEIKCHITHCIVWMPPRFIALVTIVDHQKGPRERFSIFNDPWFFYFTLVIVGMKPKQPSQLHSWFLIWIGALKTYNTHPNIFINVTHRKTWSYLNSCSFSHASMLRKSLANVKCPQNHTNAYCKYNNTWKGLCVVELNVRVAKWKSLHVQG
jgi:hypothetical protein